MAGNKPSTAKVTGDTGSVARVERSGRFRPPLRGGGGRRGGRRSFLDALFLSLLAPFALGNLDIILRTPLLALRICVLPEEVLPSAWFDSGCQCPSPVSSRCLRSTRELTLAGELASG